MIAAGVVALELCFPLALVFKRVRVPIVVATLLMQVGIGLVMGIWFLPFLFLYLFWVPWDRVGRLLAVSFARGRATAGQAPAQHADAATHDAG